MMPGGQTQAQPINADAQGAFDAVRSDFGAKIGNTNADVKLNNFRSQVVAGIKYYIDVSVGTDHYEVVIWAKLDKSFELLEVNKK